MTGNSPGNAVNCIEGFALLMGDDINMDQVHPPAHYSLDPEKVRGGFLAGLARKVPDRPGIIVAGRNFGCGSSRETGAKSFILAGIHAVLAESFARIFYRNAMNLGLPSLVLKGAREHVGDADHLSIDLNQMILKDLSKGFRLSLETPDPYWHRVIAAGGLINLIKAGGPAWSD